MSVKSKDRLNVFINKNFIIRVQTIQQNIVTSTKLTSANKLSEYLQDEELKIRLFNNALSCKTQEYTKKVRNRLIIVFRSK